MLVALSYHPCRSHLQHSSCTFQFWTAATGRVLTSYRFAVHHVYRLGMHCETRPVEWVSVPAVRLISRVKDPLYISNRSNRVEEPSTTFWAVDMYFTRMAYYPLSTYIDM